MFKYKNSKDSWHIWNPRSFCYETDRDAEETGVKYVSGLNIHYNGGYVI